MLGCMFLAMSRAWIVMASIMKFGRKWRVAVTLFITLFFATFVMLLHQGHLLIRHELAARLPTNLQINLAEDLQWTWESCDRNIKRKKVLYIKTPKTASTTLRYILLKYANRHNLHVCTDAFDIYHMNFPSAVNVNHVLRSADCDIIADEMVWDEVILKSFYVTPDDVLRMTSVRNPVENFLSMFKHFNVDALIRSYTDRNLTKHECMRIMLARPELVQRMYLASMGNKPDVHGRSGFQILRPNIQVFSALGIQDVNKLDDDQLRSIISSRLQNFHFISVCDYFNESMVMLKKAMCLSFHDILYTPVNARREKDERLERLPLDVVDSIKRFHRADEIMYDIVNRSFWSHAQRLSNFEHELSQYKSLLEGYSKRCSPKVCSNWADLPVLQESRNRTIGSMSKMLREEVTDLLSEIFVT